jgi:hypothetical protein
VLKNGGFGKFKGGKPMKKFLSIALALAMTLSLAVVGASAKTSRTAARSTTKKQLMLSPPARSSMATPMALSTPQTL